ncbi:MAG: sulfatase [Chitinophagales bacterium]|nr:sulfatase [Chitinophagales bacterium]
MMKRKHVLIAIVVLLSVVAVSSGFLLRKFESDKFKIYFDEKLIEGKKQYLSEPIEDYSKYNRPNIILILADDLGQTDISLYGNTKINTPNIDRLGREGATFTEGYISSPVCSPSRAGLLTGRYQQRFGHEFQPNHRYLKNMLEYFGFRMLPRFKPLSPIKTKEVPEVEERLRQGLPPSEITMAELLKKYGYTCGITGKWHLGAADFALPCNRGFDYQYGFYEAFTMYAEKKDTAITHTPVRTDYMDMHQWKTAEGRTGNCAILRNCCERMEENKYLTDVLTNEAIAFMERSKDKPFFLYLPYNAPHSPLQAPNSYYEQFKHIADPVKRTYAAMIKKLDDEVGRVMKYVESNGLAENTLIVFLSDNGGAVYNGTTDNAPYRGGKLTNFEGGLRVPFLMNWKGKIAPNTVVHHPVISFDVFATITAYMGIELPADRTFDGANLLPHLTAKTSEPPHEKLLWRSEFNKAIRKDEWKLMLNEYDGTQLLYHMPTDSTERINVAAKHPELVKQLTNEINQWETELVAPLWPRVVNYVYKDEGGKNTFAF